MIIKKIILIGEIGVGKTSIARRMAFDKFGDIYKATIGVDVYRYECEPSPVAGTPFHFLIWDTDGSHGENIFRQYYARQAQAAMIVGDVTRPASIDAMMRLAARYEAEVPGRYCAYVLNKVDLTGDEPPPELVKRFAATKIPLYWVSARSGHNLPAAFAKSAVEIIRLEG